MIKLMLIGLPARTFLIDTVANNRGAYYCNSPIAVGRRTADGAIMLLLAAMRGLVSQVSLLTDAGWYGLIWQDQSCRQGNWWDRNTIAKDWRECTVRIPFVNRAGSVS